MDDMASRIEWLRLALQLLPVLWLIVAVETRYLQTLQGVVFRGVVVGVLFCSGWAAFCLAIIALVDPPGVGSNPGYVQVVTYVSALVVVATAMFAVWGLVAAAMKAPPHKPS